jgi:hypothetical protein
LVALGLLAGLSTPVDLVWCRSGDGHSAIESASLGCCNTSDGALSCVAPAAIPGDVEQPTATRISDARCVDIPLGTPVLASPAARQHSPAATPAGLPVWAHVRATGRQPGVALCRGGERQVRDTLRSTVLTL